VREGNRGFGVALTMRHRLLGLGGQGVARSKQWGGQYRLRSRMPRTGRGGSPVGDFGAF